MSDQPGPWLTLEETTDYIGVGKTTLYAMARDGKIPAQKVGKKWTFEKAGLDAWMRASRPIESFFQGLDYEIDSNENLREPQREGYLKTSEFFHAGKNRAILQIPVGCGKTGLTSLLPLGIANGRALVIAPNLTIKNGLYEAMDITNRQKCFWRKSKVIPSEQLVTGPLATTLDTGNHQRAATRHQCGQVADAISRRFLRHDHCG